MNEHPEPEAVDTHLRQLSDEELAAEAARSRTVGISSVIAVGLFSMFILATYFATKGAQSGGNARYLTAIAENKLPYITAGFCYSVAQLFVAVLLVHILTAVRSRNTAAPRFPLYAAVAGAGVVALIYPAFTLANVVAAGDFVEAANRTAEFARDQVHTTAIDLTRWIWVVGQGLLTFAWLTTGLFGMRTGLLTRMSGTFAMAIGVTNFVAPPFAALLQIFWISAMAIMLISEGAKVPPAWKLGRAVSWSEVDAMQAEVAAENDRESPPA